MIRKMKEEIELFSRHIVIVRAVLANQPIGIMKLAEYLNLPSHRIRYSLHVLEQFGYIRASPDGAIATAKATRLLNGIDADLDDLIELLGEMKSVR